MRKCQSVDSALVVAASWSIRTGGATPTDGRVGLFDDWLVMRFLSRQLILPLAVATFVVVCGPAWTTDAQEPQNDQAADEAIRTGRPPVSLMRRKLSSTSKILEGLTTENMKLVVTGSDELLAITEAASWQVPRDAYYIHYSRDFKRIVRDLRDCAERGSVEDATFAYTHAMVSCMACHRHVRGVVPVAD